MVSYQVKGHVVSVRLGEGQTSFEVLLQEHAPLCSQTFPSGGQFVHLFRDACGELLEAQPCSEGKAKENDSGLRGKED